MSTIFTKIINGELPSYKIYEDEIAVVFLDINPLQKGQVLLVPRKEIDYIYDLDPDTYASLLKRTQYIAQILKSKLNCKRVCMIVEGYEVPHAHIKLIPTNSGADLDVKNIYSASKEELEDIHKLLNS